MSHELTLVPAYGRDYQTPDALIKDWNDGKDFMITTAVSPYCGKYTSIRDLSQFPGKQVKIRYKKLTNFILVNVSDSTIITEGVSAKDS